MNGRCTELMNLAGGMPALAAAGVRARGPGTNGIPSRETNVG